jgi:hypothetical protein
MSDLFVPRSLEELALEWPPDLDHISASSLKMATRCPEQWRQRYVLGKRMAPSPELINGRANHAAIEYSMEQKIVTHQDLPTGDVLEFFDHKFKEEVEAEGGIGELEVRDGKTLVTDRSEAVRLVNRIRSNGTGLVGQYHQTISPSVQPVAVEREFELRPGNLPVRVIGRIDLLATDPGMAAAPELIDRKTTRQKKYRPEPEWVMQGQIYQLAEPYAHRWHVSSNPMTIQTEFVLPLGSRNRAEKALEHICGKVGYYMRRYGPSEEWPADGTLHPWACNYCGFRPDCWAWAD